LSTDTAHLTRLEAQRPAHAPGLFAALSDRRIYDFLDEGPPASVEDMRATILRRLDGPQDGSADLWLNWTVFAGDTIAGYTQATVNPAAARADIAFVLSPAFWGQGVAAQACRLMFSQLFERFGPLTLHADTALGNDRSRRLLARLGFALARETGAGAFYVKDP